MRKTVVILTVLWMALAGCGGRAPKVDWALQVTGAVSTPLTLNYEDLAQMPQAELNDILMQRSLGEDTVGDWSGVPLAQILEKAGASAAYRSIMAAAADGYAVEISRDELQDAIIALKENGKWIVNSDPEHGPIRLVCPHTPANRWVFQLKELKINE